ncbi:DUF547 domain-containing protein [Formosa sediminum]|uniref:DUF547 domain-containing protein n=1 Tax=Formosa sediminum TaxID=2594004 RepID=A0A516GVE7_9FLAO|nr:DUF547 domain-containing protein [Formosa sediminum]QDO95476.1 DUF547 domain-containing protein [Formosa sediminum]
MKLSFLIVLLIPIMGWANRQPTYNKHNDSLVHYNNNLDLSRVVNHELWDALVSKYVSTEGNVDYKGFKTEENVLQAYLKILKDNAPTSTWTKEETLAYWINAYNAFTIQLILNNYPLNSILDIKDPWDIAFIEIADTMYSLGDIEHKILRKMNEPRIHFAINCASYSCPNLLNKAYRAASLETQLDVAATKFINDTSKNTLTKHTAEISKIFEWFAEDFQAYGSIINFLNMYSTTKIEKDATVSYKDYNWNLNI